MRTFLFFRFFVFTSGLLFAFFLSSCGEEPTRDWKSFPEAGRKALNRGNFSEAEHLLLKSLQEAKQWGNKDPRLAATFQELGELYRQQGKFNQAEPFLWQALPIWAQSVGPEHPEMASSLTSIALTYFAQKKFKEAEPLFKRALAIREKALGRDHPDLTQGLTEYAQLLRDTDRKEAADQLDIRRQTILHQIH